MSWILPGIVSSGVDFKSKTDFTTIPTETFSTDNGAYVDTIDFIYPGTDRVTISSIQSILWVNAGCEGTARLYDDTNSLEICSYTYDNTAETITTFGAVSNLPTGEAVFKLQYKKNSGAALQDVHMKGLLINY